MDPPQLPPSSATSEPDEDLAGPLDSSQLWRVESGDVPGCPIGTFVTLRQSGDMLEVTRPWEGVAARLDTRVAILTSANGGHELVIQVSGVEVRLVKYDGPLEGAVQPLFDVLEQSLSERSNNWTAAAVLRQYKSDKHGQEAFAKELEVFGRQGYTPVTQSADGGHIHLGRLLMTGGLSVFAGKRGTRSDGTITVTFQKGPTVVPPLPAVSESSQSAGLEILAVLERMGQLRDAGVLSQEEYETKKADLLARM